MLFGLLIRSASLLPNGRYSLPSSSLKHPRTPDGRYFVVSGRLWRLANPGLDDAVRATLVSHLKAARRAVRNAANPSELAAARARVDASKRSLGERGPAWWVDGVPDYTRHKVAATPYAGWYSALRSV